jgi:LemA protein
VSWSSRLVKGLPVTATLIVIAVVVVLLLVVSVLIYNGLVRRRNQVDNAWSQIDVQLKRRYDLIPNLVETVKGYAAHERGTLEAVTEARAQAISAQGPADQASADNVLTGALRSLFAVSESYPDLKANQNFLALQQELAETEDRAAYARQYYNDSVLSYNNAIGTVPQSIFAAVFGFRGREYFQAGGEERGPVRVQF